MKLSKLLAALPAYELTQSRNDDPDITRITADSRQVEPGTLFVAYRGVNLDSHRFIPDAIARGAAAIVSEEGGDEAKSRGEEELSPHRVLASPPHRLTVPDGREALAYLSAAWHGFPARHLQMVGITGTDGKTTTTNFLYHMLCTGHKVGMISTVNAVIGEQTLDTGLHTTTPDAPDVQRYLAQMVEAGTEICLLEVTSHGMAHHRVTACDFDVAIVTNITHEHLDLHGSLDAYRAAKAGLFESLATAAPKGLPKTAILNCDDWSFDYLKAKLAARNIAWLGYSVSGHPEASLTAHDLVYRPDKTQFTLRSRSHTLTAETTLVGDYNVSNCLAAAAAALEIFHLSPAQVQQGIAALAGVPGRMERIHEGQPFMAVVDFAHTPNALRRSLTVARTLTPGRVIAVFGCAGLRDVEKRVLMGQIAAELADLTLITAEDPRTENLDAIIAATAEAMLAKGAIEGQTFERVPDRGRAIYRATQLAGPDDIVIALGKGHEQSMCFGETEYPWDDRQAMRSALRGQPLLILPTATT
ncbi:MAG: UDP-N-acetylmuramoyl-L-alanyl-D-glutamate--2,6-diaminopimelate ligase [Anaerolineae bacterium]|nr:UDP-N-acetylmuramoyl-L-alanyl-D-glutamate--2,6-diaminopimelate ligase [Anaerolineae bacterium]